MKKIKTYRFILVPYSFLILASVFSIQKLGNTNATGHRNDTVTNNFTMVSTSLSVAGIKSMDTAIERISYIADYVKKEGPKLIVHSVNWYRYDSLNEANVIGWSGINKGKNKINLTSKPLFGYYSCKDSNYIDWVLGFSKALGVDELNIDYEGGIDYPSAFQKYYRNRSWDSWFMNLLHRAEKFNMQISVMYEPKSIAGRLAVREGKEGPILTNDPSYPEEAMKLLKSDLKLICDNFCVKQDKNGHFVSNTAYKRLAGIPVIWVFWMTAGGLTVDIWKQAINELKTEGYLFILIPNTYRQEQTGFDKIAQGLNPWLDQLFIGFQSNYPALWSAAQKAAEEGDSEEAKRITNQYINEIATKGLHVVAPVRKANAPANFNISPLAIGFQDADVNAWGLRPPVYIQPNDRTRTEPGKLFGAYFSEAQKAGNTWYMICSGDDIAEKTHMLIPDEEYGFSGPYAISLVSSFLGKSPDLKLAINITESFTKHQYNGKVPENVQLIIDEARKLLPGRLEQETKSITH